MQTALDIAEAGFDVDIVEKQPTIGGKMTQIDKTFPTLDCASCILTPKMVDVAHRMRMIHIYAYPRGGSGFKGFVGNFTRDDTERRPAIVEATDVCTGCGRLHRKVSLEKKEPNEFNMGFNNRRAIYIPFAQRRPESRAIDPSACTMLKTGKCGVCSKVCYRRRHRLHADRTRLVEEEYGAIVAATGLQPHQ